MTAALSRITVIVPAFNAESSIDAALESVFAQTYTAFDVVVVNDGSTDRTAARLERWRDRVTVLSQPNGGPARARNTAIKASRGKYVAFLDADDLWLPEKLALQVEYFTRHPETGLLHTAVLSPDAAAAAGAATGNMPPPSPPRGAFCELFHTDLDINTLTVMVPRRVLDEVGLFDERREIHVEDWDLWLRIAAWHPIGYVPRPTAIRRPGGGMSAAVEKTFEGQAEVIRKNEPLCHAACPLHAGGAQECRDRRWHRFHWERGYARQRAGDPRGARQAYRAALRHRPGDVSTYAQYAGTFAGDGARAAVRRLRGIGGSGLLEGRPHTSHTLDPLPRDQEPRDVAAEAGVSLVHDTIYRRTRHLLVERLRDVDDLLTRRGNRKRVLFQAASPMSFVIFGPVYEKLRTDPRLEFWFTTAGGTWDPQKLYTQVGIHENLVPNSDATWMKVDACINTDFWDSTWLRRRTARIHLFHGVAGKYGLDAPVDIAPVVGTYDRLLFPNRDRLERYAEAGLVCLGSPRAVLVGYPKVDRLVDGSLDTAAILAGLALDRTRRTVIYAPTWSPYSSLNLFGEEIIRGLVDGGFNVIVKLHDRSYDLNPRGSGGIDWGARMAAYAGNRRVRVVTDADSTPFLAVSDAMVTDHSSVGFEFALLNRPIVIMHCPELIERARVARSKVLQLRAASEVVGTPSEAAPAIWKQLEAPGLHRRERAALAREFFYEPGTAAERAARVVYEVLGLPAPEPSPSRLSSEPGVLAPVPR